MPGPLFHEATVDPRIAILGQAAEPLPIVLPDAGDYFGLWESSPPLIHDRIAFVGMPAGVASPDIEPEIIAWRWKGVSKDLRVFHAEEWFARSPQFYLLYASDTREGLVPWLIQHAAVTVAAHDSYLWLFKVDVSGLATK